MFYILRSNGLCQVLLYSITVAPKRNIFHVDFDAAESKTKDLKDADGRAYQLQVIGSDTIRAILTDTPINVQVSNPVEYEPTTPGQPPNPTTGIESVSAEEAQPEERGMGAGPVTEASNITGMASPHTAQQEAMQVQAEHQITLELHEKCVRLNVVLKSYGIQAQPVNESLVQQAARFTRFKLELKPGETESNLKKTQRGYCPGA